VGSLPIASFYVCIFYDSPHAFFSVTTISVKCPCLVGVARPVTAGSFTSSLGRKSGECLMPGARNSTSFGRW